MTKKIVRFNFLILRQQQVGFTIHLKIKYFSNLVENSTSRIKFETFASVLSDCSTVRSYSMLHDTDFDCRHFAVNSLCKLKSANQAFYV